MLESLIHEVAGGKAVSMHYDLSNLIGKKVVVFSLAAIPRFSPWLLEDAVVDDHVRVFS